ncbi:MAG: hypothetical protein GXZ14_11410 [Ruminococcaceae bacterium]|nr:hypothetical protein [Oscillospiraceae bacterium]
MEEEKCEIKENTRKHEIIAWIKAHKKQLIFAGISIPTVIMITLGLKNKDAIKALWDELRDEIETGSIYSSKLFDTVSDEVLDVEREKVRIAYCSSGSDFSEACRLQNLLWSFDKEMSKRAWGDEIPHAPSIHREHGWYLPNDD